MESGDKHVIPSPVGDCVDPFTLVHQISNIPVSKFKMIAEGR